MNAASTGLAEATTATLTALPPGLTLLFGGNRLARVPEEIAAAFRPGDRLVVVQTDGDVLHIPAASTRWWRRRWRRAEAAFAAMGEVDDARIAPSTTRFAARLDDDAIWRAIAAGQRRRRRPRHGARPLDHPARRRRAHAPRDDRGAARLARRCRSQRGRVLETIAARRLARRAGGRRAGRRRLRVRGPAERLRRRDRRAAQRQHRRVPHRQRRARHRARDHGACAGRRRWREAGLPEGAVVLLDSAEHAAGWAMFCRSRASALAVARGSGPAVATLGALAPPGGHAGQPARHRAAPGSWPTRRADAPSCLRRRRLPLAGPQGLQHAQHAAASRRARAAELVPVAVDALERARRAARPRASSCTSRATARPSTPAELFTTTGHACGAPKATSRSRWPSRSPPTGLGREWEWEQTPEVTLHRRRRR